MEPRTGDTLTIIVPAYNEAASLRTLMPELVSFCERNGFTLLVVDDGSKDETPMVLNEYAARPHVLVVTNKVNKGYGGAIKAGVRAAKTRYVVTIDADGQHSLDDVLHLHREIQDQDADMIVGRRAKVRGEGVYRKIGKWVIRRLARILLTFHVQDLNSGMKIYDAELGRRYLPLCPNSMAYSDIITLVFISQRHLVLERPISVRPRVEGKSTINTMTALDTVREIVNIVVLFNPMKIFFPLSVLLIVAGIAWGLPIVLQGRGVSIGALLGLISGLIFFFLGLIAEQLALIRKGSIAEEGREG
jgi:glycosyltransferase involved in cell wall biosynthesis